MIPSTWTSLLALLFAALIVFNQLITESQKFANFLGGWARKWHNRAQARHRLDSKEFDEALRARLAEQRAELRTEWEQNESRALTLLDRRLDAVSEISEAALRDLTELRFQVRAMTAYTEYEASWHHKLRIKAMQADRDGGHLPVDELIDHVDFWNFEKRFRLDENWKAWAFATTE